MLRVKKWVAAVLSVAMLTAGWVESTEAGPTNGREIGVHRVEARSKDVFHVTFRGGESAAVVIDGDGDTDLDLYVYDENGNLIGSDTDNSDTCVVQFRPRWTGRFRIEVHNLGRVYNVYEIAAA